MYPLFQHQLQQKQTAEARHHINVVQFEMSKPSNLPFHLLAWGQQYVRVRNCYAFYPKPPQPSAAAQLNNNAAITSTREQLNHGGATAEQLSLFSPLNLPVVNTSLLPSGDNAYDICWPHSITASYQGPLKLVYMKKFDVNRWHRHKLQRGSASAFSLSALSQNVSTDVDIRPLAATAASVTGSSHLNNNKLFAPVIRWVYFTESDQIVRFDSMQTMRAVSAATNQSTFFVGRRKEKNGESDPSDYMGTLDRWKDCGTAGYSMSWPQEHVIAID